ncbi:MAG: hypothetical protein RLZZ403_1415 [Pseudomonadota bacterium]|jgi:hypothetical protein
MTAPADPLDTIRQWGGPAILLAVAGWIGRRFVAWRKRTKAAAQMHALEGKAIRYLLDAQRHALHMLVRASEDDRLIDLDEMTRQKVLIDDMRDQIWIADGHEGQHATEQAAADIMKFLTRTQAIQAKFPAPDAAATNETPMFKD